MPCPPLTYAMPRMIASKEAVEATPCLFLVALDGDELKLVTGRGGGTARGGIGGTGGSARLWLLVAWIPDDSKVGDHPRRWQCWRSSVLCVSARASTLTPYERDRRVGVEKVIAFFSPSASVPRGHVARHGSAKCLAV